MNLRGLLSFPLTPFSAEDDINLDLLAEHVDQQIAAGPSAVFVACGTGEFTALDLDEYRDVVRTAVRTANGRVPVFAGVGGGPGIARQYLTNATECGADGALLLPPYLVSSTSRGLVNHVRYVADRSDIPVIVYRRSTAQVDAESAVDLLDVPAIIGVKDGIGDVDAMRRIVTAVRTSGQPRSGEFLFFNGLPTAELSVQAYRAIGVEAYSSAVHCFAPDIAGTFYDAVSAGDAELAQRLLSTFYLPLAALRDQVPGYAVALIKAGARLAGLPVGGVRPPLVDPPPEHEEQLGAIIERGRATLSTVRGVSPSSSEREERS